jgi:hypothetical protein
MENTKKVTKRDNFNKLLTIEEVANDTQLVEFINHELELLDKKSASHSTAKTANQKANEEIKKSIVNALVEIGKSTISELQKANEEMAQYSNQKLSALLKQMVDSKKVIKTIDKKKSYFEVAE